jgi:hypothetical protein
MVLPNPLPPYPHSLWAYSFSFFQGMVQGCSLTEGGVGKRYTLTVSNEIATKRPDGRDFSTLVYEYSFDTPHTGDRSMQKYVEWKDFEPMYRGRKPDDDVPGLDISRIRRWSIMVRSFFEVQEGEFRLGLRCVCGYSDRDGKGGKEELVRRGSFEKVVEEEEEEVGGEREERCCLLQ